MSKPACLFCVIVLSPILFLSACNLPNPTAAGPAGSAPTGDASLAVTPVIGMPTLPQPPTTGDFIQILAANPPAATGLSPSNTITLTLRYRLEVGTGTLQIWFERFKDANCTTLDSDASGSEKGGGSTIPGGVMQTISGGSQETLIVIPPVPPLDASYVSMGARLWTEDTFTALAEDMLYANCYAVHGVPVVAGVTPGVGPVSSGNGTIAGFVYRDQNRSGAQDVSEPGESAYPLTLADVSCIHSLASATPDATGHFSFSGLSAGTYCLALNYSGGLVAPGTWQRVDVMSGSSSPAFFGIQPARLVTYAVCGNSVLESGEECDPPNVTNCTASCQRYIASCGNGIVDVGEQCDPPNVVNCTASCQNYSAACGNGIIDWGVGEQCDPPNVSDCTASCQSYTASCGNGIVDPGEGCDPPNVTNCTASCQNYVAVCGNGIIDWGVGEQCDPPNVIDCTASCQSYIPVCGNGIVDWGETCDPPNTTDCTASCQIWP